MSMEAPVIDPAVPTNPHNLATHPELPNVSVYLVKVDKDIAAEMLKLNAQGQRKLSAEAVERYAGDMATDEWIFNGASILISKDNELLDGQHRLRAIIESEEAQILLVVHGVDTDAMGTVDMNRRRSYADTLAMKGYSNHATIGAINARLWYWAHGNYGVKGVGRVAQPKFLSTTPSNSQKDLWMMKYEKAYGITIEHAASFAKKAQKRRPKVVAGTYGLMWVLLSGVDKDLREGFFNELIFEEDPKKMSPATMAFVNRLGRLGARETLNKVDQLDMLITCFNFWVAGKAPGTYTPPRPVRFDKLAKIEGYTELEEL